MDEKVKQRLVGLAVLVSLAVLFLPTLFYRDEPVIIDTTSLIPSAPSFEPIEVPEAVKPANVELSPSPVFSVDENQTIEAVAESEKPIVQEELPKTEPTLNSQGVPKGWLLQVASLKLQESAEQLVKSLEKDNHRAYWEPASTSQGDLFRVFIGPFIDPATAEKTKKQVDQAYKVDSRVLRFNPVSGD